MQTYADVVERGRHSDFSRLGSKGPTDIGTIVYTRGSYQLSLHTEQNLVAELTAYQEVFDPTYHDRHLSYLDISQLYERMNVYCMLYNGAKIGFHSGPTR